MALLCGILAVVVATMSWPFMSAETIRRTDGEVRKSPILVLVAASMRETMDEIAKAFSEESGIEVTISSGPSSSLARQISAGSLADVFVSASSAWADSVTAAGLASESRALASNRLVVIVPVGSTTTIVRPEDLLQEPVRYLALAGEHVPAGEYAEQAIRKADVYAQLAKEGRIVRGHDVRVALAYVEQGEADAAIVYSTDAMMSDRVRVAYKFPADSHDPIAYFAVLLKRAAGTGGTNDVRAKRFFEFLLSPRAEEILERQGFGRPGLGQRTEGVPLETTATLVGDRPTAGRLIKGIIGERRNMWPLTPEEMAAIKVSLLVATVAVAGSLPFGIGLGWLLARRQFTGKAIVETVVNLPLVLPPVVTGYLLLRLFGRNAWLGRLLEETLGVRFIFDWKGAALASAVVSFPLMLRAIQLAFLSVDRKLEQAASSLGATPLDCFFSVSLPLARHGLIAGCLLAFARSIGEFGATIMLAGNIPGQTQTIPLFIYNEIESPDGIASSQTIVIVSVAISAGALIAGELLQRRTRRRLGLA